MFLYLGMKKHLTNLLPFFTIGVVLLLVNANLNWGKDHWKGVLEADAKGYYTYLPAAFIYTDANFSFFDEIEREKYYNKNWFYEYRSSHNGHVINKYYIGTAIAEAPFFLLAHAYTLLTEGDADGYSKPYIMSVNLAALFYLLAGLYFLNQIIRNSIGNRIRWLLLAATVFGTNLFYYAIVEPGMSHVFSFAFVSFFLFSALKYRAHRNSKWFLLLAFSLGMIAVIRPINILIVLALPFLFDSWKSFKEISIHTFKNWHILSLALLLFCLPILPQLIWYKIATGDFLVYAYAQEGFNFLDPNMINILFSYQKGLFLYTPFYALCLLGLVSLFKQNRYHFYCWTVFFLVLTYILSSWWMWFYGGSFSSRVYVEYLPLFVVLLAWGYQELSKPLKTTVITASIVFTVLCQIQTYQYRYYQIHWSEMTKEKYWDVFLRLDKL